MDRVRQWNIEKRIQNPELRLTYRSGAGPVSRPPVTSSLAFDSSRPVDVVAVRQYLKRKRDEVEQEHRPRARGEASTASHSPGSQPSQPSQRTERSFRGSHNWDESLSLAISRTTTPSSNAASTNLNRLRFDNIWRRTEPSYPIFRFMSDYNPILARPGMTADERNRVNMLSSCSIFLRSRARRSDPSLPLIDVSSNSKAIAAHEKHLLALDFFEQDRQIEAGEAVDACCDMLKFLVLSQQPSLLSCVTVVISELTSSGRPEFAAQVLQFVSDLAAIRLGQRHPITIFLWCMRASDVPTQRLLTEEFLKLGIAEMEMIDPKGLTELITDYQYRLLRIYNEQGKLTEALQLMKNRAYHYEVHFGHYHRETSNIIYQIARTHFLAGDMVEARFNFEDVLARVPSLTEDRPHRGWLRINATGRLAQIWKKLGDDQRARDYATECLNGPNEGEEDSEDIWRKVFADESILNG